MSTAPSALSARSSRPQEYAFAYDAGEYVVRKVNPDLPAAPVVYVAGRFDDVVVAVDARIVEPTGARYALAVCRDATADGRFQYPDSARAEGLVSVLSAPLMVDGKAIGLIRVYSAQEREFTADEQTFMEAVAAISALAIENARLHEALRNNYELMTKHAYSVYED